MKKAYEKPVVEVVEFNLQDNIMGDTTGGIDDGFDTSTGVEEW